MRGEEVSMEKMDMMEIMCDETNFIMIYGIEQEVSEYKDAGLEEDYDWDNHQRSSWADLTEEEYKTRIFDDLTGAELKYEKVLKARLGEIEALKKMGVWEIVPTAQCLDRTKSQPIKGRWVDVNNGDSMQENYASRNVARELRHSHGGPSREGLFAAMPPPGCIQAPNLEDRQPRPPQMDISKAYLHVAVIDPDLYVELPSEMGLPWMCGHLKKARYGTRVAARCWEMEYTGTLCKLGFTRGKSSPCIFRHHTWDCCIFIHGVGFVVSGVEEHLKQGQKAICDVYLTKVRGVIGPESHDTKAMTILNRIVEWRTDGIVMEADPRHVELVLRELGMEQCKGSDVVGHSKTAETTCYSAPPTPDASDHWR